jgi:hypothetical protein
VVDGSNDASCLLGLGGLAVEHVALTAGGIKVMQLNGASTTIPPGRS